jgi:hypothetical protein
VVVAAGPTDLPDPEALVGPVVAVVAAVPVAPAAPDSRVRRRAHR